MLAASTKVKYNRFGNIVLAASTDNEVALTCSMSKAKSQKRAKRTKPAETMTASEWARSMAKRRAAQLTPKRRQEIAKNAAAARWGQSTSSEQTTDLSSKSDIPQD